MQYELTTSGERLAAFIYHRFVHPMPWQRLANHLEVTGRAEHLLDFFKEVIAVSLCCRLVSISTTLLDEPARAIDDPTYTKDLKLVLREQFSFPESIRPELFRACVRATQASRQHIGATQRVKLKRGAMARYTKCYMCGRTLDYTEADPNLAFTLEHLWPQSYGGESDNENLLPACRDCNGRKADFATWAMVHVQSLMLGVNPSENALASVDGRLRFALHYHAARRLAEQMRTTLRTAFIRLGPWNNQPRIVNDYTDADFYNLAIHNSLPHLERN